MTDGGKKRDGYETDKSLLMAFRVGSKLDKTISLREDKGPLRDLTHHNSSNWIVSCRCLYEAFTLALNENKHKISTSAMMVLLRGIFSFQ